MVKGVPHASPGSTRAQPSFEDGLGETQFPLEATERGLGRIMIRPCMALGSTFLVYDFLVLRC
jgi:hypothetical protein